MVNFNGVTISHFLPGRIRVRVQQLKMNDDLADQIRNYASGMELIEHFKVNTLTGSVLIEYNPDQKEEIEQLVSQTKYFNLLPEEIDLEEIHAILEGKQKPASLSVDFSGNVRFFFDQLNNKVKRISGNKAGLNELIPLGLFGLGIRNLLAAESIVGPLWHTYFWYAFSTFLVLNPTQENSSDKRRQNKAVSG